MTRSQLRRRLCAIAGYFSPRTLREGVERGLTDLDVGRAMDR